MITWLKRLVGVRSIPDTPPPEPVPKYMEGWRMCYCSFCDSQWMYMPNDPNNRRCPCGEGRKP